MRIKHIIFGGLLAILASAPGCVTMEDSSAATSNKEDLALLREDLTRLQGRVETVDLENKRLNAEIEQGRTPTSADTHDQQMIQGRLDELEKRIQAVDAARVKDRQTIVDQLSGKMAEIIAGGGKANKIPAAASARPSSGSSSSAGAEPAASGGVHIVKEGETLSTIAATYKVKANAIIRTNNLENPNALRVGQKLIIP